MMKMMGDSQSISDVIFADVFKLILICQIIVCITLYA
jgi:hypothetical protein